MGKPRFTEVSEEVADMFLKANAIADRIDSLEKAQPEYSVSFNTKPQEIMLVSETGGQTRNSHYTTNNHLLDSDDVANKGARRFSVNLDALSPNMNPQGSPAKGHLTEG
jgi:hypothetical protein|tara:strand:+ start:424 stop:750 length:327 start_codon:yes stop_codon:yes gene_type:complete